MSEVEGFFRAEYRRYYLLNQLGNQPPSQCRRWGGRQTGSARVSSANRTYGP